MLGRAPEVGRLPKSAQLWPLPKGWASASHRQPVLAETSRPGYRSDQRDRYGSGQRARYRSARRDRYRSARRDRDDRRSRWALRTVAGIQRISAQKRLQSSLRACIDTAISDEPLPHMVRKVDPIQLPSHLCSVGAGRKMMEIHCLLYEAGERRHPLAMTGDEVVADRATVGVVQLKSRCVQRRATWKSGSSSPTKP